MPGAIKPILCALREKAVACAVHKDPPSAATCVIQVPPLKLLAVRLGCGLVT